MASSSYLLFIVDFVATVVYISPKSSPLEEDGVIIFHLILQIILLSKPAEMANREEWLQNLNNLHIERGLNQIYSADWHHIW